MMISGSRKQRCRLCWRRKRVSKTFIRSVIAKIWDSGRDLDGTRISKINAKRNAGFENFRERVCEKGVHVHLQSLDIGTQLFDHSRTFMSQTHVRTQVMLIGTAQAAVRNFEKDLLAIQLIPAGCALDGVPICRALVHGEFNALAVRTHGLEKLTCLSTLLYFDSIDTTFSMGGVQGSACRGFYMPAVNPASFAGLIAFKFLEGVSDRL
jgi:hypothetical protein